MRTGAGEVVAMFTASYVVTIAGVCRAGETRRLAAKRVVAASPSPPPVTPDGATSSFAAGSGDAAIPPSRPTNTGTTSKR